MKVISIWSYLCFSYMYMYFYNYSVQLPQRPATQQQQQQQLPRQQKQQQLPQPQQLDYSKMKSDLKRSSNTRKALLLQAIRWVGPAYLPPFPHVSFGPTCFIQRLTRSLAPVMDGALRDFISNDILGCASPSSEV